MSKTIVFATVEGGCQLTPPFLRDGLTGAVGDVNQPAVLSVARGPPRLERLVSAYVDEQRVTQRPAPAHGPPAGSQQRCPLGQVLLLVQPAPGTSLRKQAMSPSAVVTQTQPGSPPQVGNEPPQTPATVQVPLGTQVPRG